MTAEFTPEVIAVIDGRSMGVCEVCGNARIAEHHHRRPRGSGGTRRADAALASNGLGVCRTCHRLIHANGNLANVMGWLVRQNTHPAAESVVIRGIRMYLDDDGQYLQEAA